jgi:hypothetical protein
LRRQRPQTVVVEGCLMPVVGSRPLSTPWHVPTGVEKVSALAADSYQLYFV